MSETVKYPNVEERIIRAAQSVFLEKGYTDASMSEIAERVGINRSGLHYYFRTKDKMFHAVFGRIIESIIPRFHDIMLQKDKPVSRRVDEVVDIYYNMLLENPYLPLFLIREINRDADFLVKTVQSLHLESYFEKLRQSLSEEMAAGALRRVPLRIVFFTFYGALTFPFVSRNIVVRTMIQRGETFEDVLAEWKPYIVGQMSHLLAAVPES